jgi:hypothetical protein
LNYEGVSRRVILVDTITSAEGVNMGHRNRGIGFEVSESRLEPTNILCYKIGDSLPYGSDFALDFVPDVIDRTRESSRPISRRLQIQRKNRRCSYHWRFSGIFDKASGSCTGMPNCRHRSD